MYDIISNNEIRTVIILVDNAIFGDTLLMFRYLIIIDNQ